MSSYAEILCEMISCETVNLHEVYNAAAFEKIEKVYQKNFPNVFDTVEKIEIKHAFFYKWRGRKSDEAVVLMSHSDVVPADGKWDYPPFEGTVEGGRIYGRGSVDTKGSLCAIFSAAEELIASGFVPAYDTYILSSHNEETNGDGAPNARDYFVENNIKVKLVSDEGGAILEAPMPGLKGRFAMLGIAEKGLGNLKFIAKSHGGHASTPPKNSPLARVAAFIGDVERKSPFSAKISPIVRDMFRTLAPHMSGIYKFLFGNLWLTAPLVRKVMPMVSGQAAAMLRTTCAFTMAEGSAACNVMPDEASVTANLRFISHQRMNESIEIISKIAEKHDLTTEIICAHDHSAISDTACSEFKIFCESVKSAFSDVTPAPYLMTAATDSRYFAEICSCVIRFSPMFFSNQQLNSMHADNENLDIDALEKAVNFYKILVGNIK